ncbi:class I SAM-dependent methyltransferase [bacterium]|nr:class I SAM-dependent methyltransferase [bacterium]
MDPMTRADFDTLLQTERSGYYAGRWAYFSEVVKIVGRLPVQRTLEIGPGLLPIVKDADLMLSPLEDPFGIPKTFTGARIVHDATASPWPLENNQYDLVIALQVFEHLDNKQSRAFREIMRVSRRAILSFPYMWTGGLEKPSHRAHRDIDRQLIFDWTLNIPPKEMIEIPRTGDEFSKGPRLIGFLEFE